MRRFISIIGWEHLSALFLHFNLLFSFQFLLLLFSMLFSINLTQSCRSLRLCVSKLRRWDLWMHHMRLESISIWKSKCSLVRQSFIVLDIKQIRWDILLSYGIQILRLHRFHFLFRYLPWWKIRSWGIIVSWRSQLIWRTLINIKLSVHSWCQNQV